MRTLLTVLLIAGMGYTAVQAQDSYTAGIRLLHAGDTSAAISAFRKASDERGRAGEAHMQIAMYYASRTQPERSISSFARAERSGFETSAMQLSWGLAILQVAGSMANNEDARARSAEAVKRFQRAVQLDAQSAPAHFWLGEALLRLRVPGDNVSVHKYTDEACQEFKKAVAIDPHHEGALKEIRLRGCK